MVHGCGDIAAVATTGDERPIAQGLTERQAIAAVCALVTLIIVSELRSSPVASEAQGNQLDAESGDRELRDGLSADSTVSPRRDARGPRRGGRGPLRDGWVDNGSALRSASAGRTVMSRRSTSVLPAAVYVKRGLMPVASITPSLWKSHSNVSRSSGVLSSTEQRASKLTCESPRASSA